MVIVFPGNKGALSKPSAGGHAEPRSPSFAHALLLALLLSAVMWGGLVALTRL